MNKILKVSCWPAQYISNYFFTMPVGNVVAPDLHQRWIWIRILTNVKSDIWITIIAGMLDLDPDQCEEPDSYWCEESDPGFYQCKAPYLDSYHRWSLILDSDLIHNRIFNNFNNLHNLIAGSSYNHARISSSS